MNFFTKLITLGLIMAVVCSSAGVDDDAVVPEEVLPEEVADVEEHSMMATRLETRVLKKVHKHVVKGMQKKATQGLKKVKTEARRGHEKEKRRLQRAQQRNKKHLKASVKKIGKAMEEVRGRRGWYGRFKKAQNHDGLVLARHYKERLKDTAEEVGKRKAAKKLADEMTHATFKRGRMISNQKRDLVSRGSGKVHTTKVPKLVKRVKRTK